ncbi:hypothetical protein NDU88_006600 [Pleurodeles waltl]|uniref:Uncharacterized protein n=1 Tax=Pleurodeles waltl TaxID=8319 RepID=A0AAV7PJ75_PLEWA|nr:hypothetical protein NDU88_006600 [Pleurodeles waltl]
MPHRVQQWTASCRRYRQWAAGSRERIAGVKVNVPGHCGLPVQSDTLEQRVTMVEAQATLAEDRDQELLYLRSKVINLEDRSRRDNVLFLGFPEEIEGTDVQSFLKNILPQLTGLTFDPLLEFQRAHRLGPKRREGSNHR